MDPFDFLQEFAGTLNTTGYDRTSDWSSASWGNGWAGTPGGVARQFGLKGRDMAEFARAVNNQKRKIAEEESGYDYGYKPEITVPSWIQNLYESKGQDTGGFIPTGESGVGKYVDLGAINTSSFSDNSKGRKERMARVRARRQERQTEQQNKRQVRPRGQNQIMEYTKLAGSKSKNPEIRQRVKQINKTVERRRDNARRR